VSLRHMSFITVTFSGTVSLFRQLRLCVRATAGQEDPFELDSNLLLSSGRHGEDRKRQYNSRCTTMKHRYLTIWLTYCISIVS